MKEEVCEGAISIIISWERKFGTILSEKGRNILRFEVDES